MWSKKTFLTAVIVLILTSATNAEVILTLNGFDATMEYAEVQGKNELIIAVAGSTEAEPNAYSITASGGVMEVIAGADNNNPQAEQYSFTFEDELTLGIVSVIANTDMVVDGTSVKVGDKIYELILLYIPERDTVIGVGVNLESLICAQPQQEAAAESQSTSELKPESEAESVPKPKTFLEMSEQERKRLRRLRYFPEDGGQRIEDGNQMTEEGTINNESAELFAMDSNSTYIEIPDGTIINTNTIWDTNIYLQGYVFVDNAMLVIKPGVTIWIESGFTPTLGGIRVRNNGCIIANGTPDNKIAFFPTTYVPTHDGYNYAVLIEETASSLCEVSYCTIIDAEYGIVILNNRLENPIHDNSIRHGCWGIREEGPMLTDIVNNEIFDSVTDGITTYLSDINGIASNTTKILIENNTIANVYEQDGNYGRGIYVEGVEDPNEAGEVTIANNLLAACQAYAICPVNGWMKLAMYCNGFYSNNGDVYGGTGGGWMSGGIVDANSIIVEDFNSYECTDESGCGDKAIRAVWKDYYTNGTGALVSLWQGSVNTNLVIDGNSMKYEYDDHTTEYGYYSVAEADICDLPSGISSDWTSGDYNTLTLYFYGQLGNDAGEQMYVKLTDGDEGDFNSVDNFDSYGSNSALRAVWKDWWTQPEPKTSAEVSVGTAPDYPVRSGQSMIYHYGNKTYSPYYSEVNATVASLGIDQNWLGMMDGTLSLWFYGQPGNDTNEPMYIKLVDGSPEEQTATVFYSDYEDMNDVNETSWHVWNIPVGDFILANCYFDITKVVKIIIGFGDGTQAASDGKVYFDDIRLYKEYPPAQHSATVLYDDYPGYKSEPRWHVWNIPLAEFNDVNLANVTKITIGFGNGTNPGGEPNGYGVVYFEDIILGQGPAEDIYFDGSVYLDKDPFENAYNNYPLLLKQDCRLINAGSNYIDKQQYLIGKTTAWEGFPDYSVADIGFHYFNWNYLNVGDGNSPSSDLDDNKIIDFRDFAILADGWETIYDINDLEIMAEEWLWAAGPHPPIAINISGDPNNLTGKVPISINGKSSYTTQGFIYVDGALKGYINYMTGLEEANNCALLDTKKLDNGRHSVKVATNDSNGLITLSQVITVDTNNDLYYVNKADYFEPNKGYHIYAMSDINSNFRVHLVGWDGNTIWTSDDSSDGLNLTVPSSVLTGQLYNIVLEAENGIAMDSESDEGDPIKNRRRKPGPYKVAIFLPNGVTDSGVFTSNSRMRAVAELMRWCEQRNMNYIILYGGECTWENFASVLSQSTVNYVYMVAHGSDRLGIKPNIVNRLNFVVSSPGFGYWGTETVVSYKGGLPGNMDSDPCVHSMESLGLNETMQIRCVYMTVCRQGVSDEMARQWLDWSMGTPLNQLFCGWEGCPSATDPDWQDWDYQFWHRWCSGEELVSEVIGGPFIPGGLFGMYPDIWSEFAPIGWTQMYFTTSGN